MATYSTNEADNRGARLGTTSVREGLAAPNRIIAAPARIQNGKAEARAVKLSWMVTWYATQAANTATAPDCLRPAQKTRPNATSIQRYAARPIRPWVAATWSVSACALAICW